MERLLVAIRPAGEHPRAEASKYALFTALSDRTRRDILVRVSTGEATVKELSEPYAMSLQAVRSTSGYWSGPA